MTRTRRAAGIAVLLAGALVLAGCTPATVCDRRETSAGKYQIRYQSEVDDGTERPKTSDWITLDKAEYDACQVGDKWPACKKDAKDEEAEVNPPRRDPDRDAQDRNARTVCFDFVSDPKRKLRYKWATPRREKGPREGTWGIFTECVEVEPGHVVNMTVEHITGPSTLMCAIYIIRNGKKVPIDLMITQAFGDCKVSAVVPPR
jgi:hypothetical protein